eukprot:NODE_2039_length_1315_cov_70.100316_g1452_i1.p1 GENE.NODE_2039_length_1315_cov_70.100316_g1452_i1~~NODE_2039_length_1315_cov_70.100316_g1452_i1.p1  ORF type:complete len:212 (+),score=31.94 NODE_2039_length_1315_cov_70.100316_g1452_i1:462-1097(+)
MRQHPVIVTVFMRGHNDADYDHIVPAVGYTSTVRQKGYRDDDSLVFNDNLQLVPHVRRFDSLPCRRKMDGNCSGHLFGVPWNVDYGIAVAGVFDENGETFRVSMSVGPAYEPNLSEGAPPVPLNVVLTAHGLSPGSIYSLLRYDSLRAVPRKDFANSNYSHSVDFTAADTEYTYQDPLPLMTDAVRIYRCICKQKGDARSLFDQIKEQQAI